MHFLFSPSFFLAELERLAGMAPVPPKKRIDDSFELKLYNSTNEPINFQLGTPSSFGLGAGSETIEALSTSSCIITPTFSPRNGVEITLDGTPYRINSPKSCGKGWIALDKDFTRSRVLIPIGERESKGNEKSVVQEPRFLVYQLGEVRLRRSALLSPSCVLTVVMSYRYERIRRRARILEMESTSSSLSSSLQSHLRAGRVEYLVR